MILVKRIAIYITSTDFFKTKRAAVEDCKTHQLVKSVDFFRAHISKIIFELFNCYIVFMI